MENGKDILKITLICTILFIVTIGVLAIFIDDEFEELPQPTKEKSLDIGEKVSNFYVQ